MLQQVCGQTQCDYATTSPSELFEWVRSSILTSYPETKIGPNSAEFKRVEEWLFSIPEDSIRIQALEAKLAQLEAEEHHLQANDYSRARVSGGNRESEQDRWLIAKEGKLRAHSMELSRLKTKQHVFETILSHLERTDPHYRKLYEVKYEKFYPKSAKPTDEDLARELGCSLSTYYRRRKYFVAFFHRFLVQFWN